MHRFSCRSSRGLLVLAALLPIAATAAESEAESAPWSGRVHVGGSLSAGNSEVFKATMEADARRKWERDELDLSLFAVYGFSNGDRSHDAQRLNGKLRRYLPRDFYVYGKTEVGRDAIQSVGLRVLMTLGPGRRMWQGSSGDEGEAGGEVDRFLDLETGVGYRHEMFSDETDTRNDVNLRTAFEYRDRWGEYLEVSHTNEWLLPVRDLKGWLARARSSLSLPIGHGWHFRTSLRVDYLNDPAQGNEKHDLLATTGIEYQY